MKVKIEVEIKDNLSYEYLEHMLDTASFIIGFKLLEPINYDIDKDNNSKGE